VVILKKKERDWKKEINYRLKDYLLFFFSFSMIGWLWEVSLCIFEGDGFINRGTLFGPWLPIYGAGGILMLFLLKRFYDRPILTFFLGMILCSIIEYATSWYLEVTKGIRWWDYSGYLFNLNGRIYLQGAIVFGLMGCAVIYWIAPYLKQSYEKLPTILTSILCILLSVLFAIDFIYSSEHPNTGEGISTPVIEKPKSS